MQIARWLLPGIPGPMPVCGKIRFRCSPLEDLRHLRRSLTGCGVDTPAAVGLDGFVFTAFWTMSVIASS